MVRLKKKQKQRIRKTLLFLFRKQSHQKFWVYIITGAVFLIFHFFYEVEERHNSFDAPFEVSEILLDCALIKVVDGDSVHAQCAGKRLNIRLLGVDAPEMGQTPWGAQSKDVLQKKLARSFSLKPMGADIYKRQLGIIYLDDEDINLYMIEIGRAVAYRSGDTPRHYYQAEKNAKSKKIGIWAKRGHQQDPKRWRRENL